jgi:hypothetical protein
MEHNFAAGMEAQGGMSIGTIIVMLVLCAFFIVCWWKVFTKAGQPGWASIIPFYNIVVMLQIARKPLWWLVMFLIPIVNFVFLILFYVEFAKAFGKGTGFALGLIFLGPIFLPILAFGSAQYVYGSAGQGAPAA